MSLIDYLILAAVLAAVCFAVYKWRDNRKKGKGCCGGSCTGCNGACGNTQK